jgi:cytochrome c oxidase assembly protein subunit 15
MADTEWPTHPLHLFFTSRDDAGYLIEHSHRLAGYVVGLLVIALAVALWVAESRRWLKWLGTLALLGVIAQGVLGGMRVLLNAWLGTDLATLHGCFAQLVFALLAAIALFTSSGWSRPVALADDAAGAAVRRLALWATALVYLQIVFGAFVRHSHLRLAQRLHFLGACVVVACIAWLVKAVWDHARGERRLLAPALVLAALLAVQVVLGVEAWMNRFGMGVPVELLPAPRASLTTGLVRTAHFVLGSLTFATTVILTLLLHRREPRPAVLPGLPSRRLEEVA